MRKAKGMAASQEELNRQQQELASEQEEFAAERTKMVASFKANAQQRMTELEASLPDLSGCQYHGGQRPARPD